MDQWNENSEGITGVDVRNDIIAKLINYDLLWQRYSKRPEVAPILVYSLEVTEVTLVVFQQNIHSSFGYFGRDSRLHTWPGLKGVCTQHVTEIHGVSSAQDGFYFSLVVLVFEITAWQQWLFLCGTHTCCRRSRKACFALRWSPTEPEANCKESLWNP